MTEFGTPESNDDAQNHDADFIVGETPEAVVEPAKRRSRRWLTIGAPIAAVVLVVGGVAIAQLASKLSGTDTPGLATALPAGTLAFAQVNLDPAANQKLAIYDIGHKFPEVKHAVSKSDPAGSLVDYVIKQDGTLPFTWGEIKQWAGVRVGIAALADADSKPYALGAVQVGDEAKAKTDLPKLFKDQHAAYKIDKGYVYISDTSQHLDAAIANLNQHGALSNDATYKTASKTIDNGDVLSGYANLGAFAPIAKQLYSQGETALQGLQGMPGMSMQGGSATMSASPGATGDTGMMLGAPSDASGALTMLPGQSAAALKQLDSLKGAVAFDVKLNGGGGKLSIDEYGQKQTQVSAGAVSAIATLPSNSVVALDVHGVADGVAKNWSAAADALTGMVTQFTDGTDIKLPDDIKAVFGTDTAFAMTADGATPQFGAIVHGGDAARAKKVIGELVNKLGGDPSVVAVDGSGGTFTVASSSEFGKSLSAGALGSQSRFTKVVPNVQNAQLAAYVDVQGLVKLDQATGGNSAKSDAALISAIGMTAADNAGVAHLEVNLALN
jgi:hypothetical protein